ncbi:MAG TPA: hypothetical protein VM682_06060 [Bacillus sp. (in: firmicutes)]|nr:hypothetical protein [Bacillus sp. (in: firmicutes)]
MICLKIKKLKVEIFVADDRIFVAMRITRKIDIYTTARPAQARYTVQTPQNVPISILNTYR